MKRQIFVSEILGIFFSAVAFGALSTEIRYEVAELGSGKWRYSYDVTNISLTQEIREFTIWFDYELYKNLATQTPEPLKSSWDEIVIQPEPVLQDDGFYDALTLTSGIGQGQTVSGFSVSFDWLGTGQPGSQFYEIIDPATFETLDSGWTIPEPTTLLLLGLGCLVLNRKRVRHEKAQREKG